MDSITIRKPDDFHVHFRQDEMLAAVLPYHEQQFARALVMPNTTPAVQSALEVVGYRANILESRNGSEFQPLMTAKLTQSTSPDDILYHAEQYGGKTTAFKAYPVGVTTNSSDGVSDFKALYPVLEELESFDLVLCIHAELPGEFSMDREAKFLPQVDDILTTFPDLRVVVEHVTTLESVDFVRRASEFGHKIAATVTLHHLHLTLDDIVGGSLNPHAFCKPIAKRWADREALRQVVLSGNPSFFLGSDSAPHVIERKECDCGAAGIFTAPVLMPALTQFFEENVPSEAWVTLLEKFTSVYGANFYKLPLNKSTLTLVRDEWKVDDLRFVDDTGGIDIVKSFLSGQTLTWQVASDRD